jgi:glycine dehydrogenase subunit 1
MTMGGYIPHTTEQQVEMLRLLGLERLEELFGDIPENIRLHRELELPKALSEMELADHMRELANRNQNTEEAVCFLGAGAYDHYIPSVVGHLLARSEFYTAYTPYQPEISQGTLQAIFEYQSMICELTGMDVSNASLYDGATALAEAASMACHATQRSVVLVARSVHPEAREVLRTYASFRGGSIQEIGYQDGRIDLEELKKYLSAETAAVIVQNPNFFGAVEDLKTMTELVHAQKALFIVSADPVSLGLLEAPGRLGADIVAGEGQSLGNSLSFGGPYLGFLAARQELLRRMPGRICGETVDKEGRRGFVLTIQTREQHIRREKANSNICSNQALNALAATIYLSIMGKKGLRQVAGLCLQKAHYLQKELVGTGMFEPVFHTPFFKEFAVKSRLPVSELNDRLHKEGIIGGYTLERDYPELAGGWLLAVTEKRTRAEMDRMVRCSI